MTGAFDSRGNKDASITRPGNPPQIDGTRRSGPVGPGRAGDPFLIGEAMTGTVSLCAATPLGWTSCVPDRIAQRARSGFSSSAAPSPEQPRERRAPDTPTTPQRGAAPR